MIDPHHIWNVIYNAQSNRHHPPTSPNTAPATQNESHDWSASHMKRHLQCAEQQASPSNFTKYCACHAKWISWLIHIPYETSFTMRRATVNTLQPHQILRLPRKMNLMIDPHHIWNVIYNARSNSLHPPTSPNTAPATPLPCHLLATGDKLPWPYLLQWLLAAGPHLDKLYRYIIMFWCFEFWNSTQKFLNGLQIYGQQRHSCTSRFIFSCISSALYYGDSTVDALLEEFSRQAKHLFFNGFVATCSCLERFFSFQFFPGNDPLIPPCLWPSIWPLRIFAVTAFISSPWDAKGIGHGWGRFFGLGWVPFALIFFSESQEVRNQQTGS